MQTKNVKIGYICIAITTVLFSLMEIALKSISGSFNPLQITFSRFFVGGLVLLPFAVRHLKKMNLRIKGRTIGMSMLIGFVGICISMLMYQLAVIFVDASVVAIIFSSNSLFVMLFAYFMLGEAIHKNNIAAIVMQLIGIGIIVVGSLSGKMSVSGIVFCLLATVTFALYGVIGKGQTKIYGGIVVTCFGFLCGSIEMMLLAALTHIPQLASMLTSAGLETFANIPFFSGYGLAELPVTLFVFVGVTGIGFASYFTAMEHTSANTASLVFFFKPVLASIFAYLLIGEGSPVYKIIGILFIVVGSLINILPGILQHRKENTSYAKV